MLIVPVGYALAEMDTSGLVHTDYVDLPKSSISILPQHLEFPSGLQSKYYLSPILINFSIQTPIQLLLRSYLAWLVTFALRD